jgi:predicted SAM-dependent methyltransferase
MISIIKKIIPTNLKDSIKSMLDRRENYTCPFCNHTSKDLMRIGYDLEVLIKKQVVGGGKRMAGCANCGSSDRDRLIYIYLKEKIKFFTNKNKGILHFAPEKYLSNKILEFGFDNYVCADYFTEGYQYPKHVLNINVLNIPFQDNTFDLVLCNHVLEHIPTDKDAMKELLRVLKVGGQAILQVPISKNSAQTYEDFSITDPKQREILFGQFDHVRIYGQDYLTRLKDAGFKVTKLNISEEFAKYGLNKDEDIFICIK